MIFILLIVVALVAWALHLMQEAIQQREFSLMLAGFLVSVAAAGLMAVYFLVGHYVGYMSQMEQHTALVRASFEMSSVIEGDGMIPLEEQFIESSDDSPSTSDFPAYRLVSSVNP